MAKKKPSDPTNHGHTLVREFREATERTTTGILIIPT